MHDELVEEIVSGDDDQLERYLVGRGADGRGARAHAGPRGARRHRVPRAARLGRSPASAIDRLADFICEIGPSPADRPVTVTAGDQQVEVTADAAGQPLAYVFKTIADPFVGQLSLFKVLSGTIKTDDHLINVDERRRRATARPVPPARQGADRRPTSLPAGDIGAVAKLANTHTGDTLAPQGHRRCGSPASTPPPAVLAIAVRPRTQADDDKLAAPCSACRPRTRRSCVERNEETRQTVLRGRRRHPPRGRARAALAQVRRQRRHRGRPRALPGDGRRQRRGRGQGQEADRRSRPVRGGHTCGSSPVDRGDGFELRRLDRRRRHPPPVHPRRPARASRRRWSPAACTASRSST